MDKVYINKLVDREDDKYTYIITTKENCKDLIEKCVRAFYDMYDYDSIEEFLEDQKEFLDKRIYDVVKQDGYSNIYDYEGVIMFIVEILNNNNLTIEDEESEIYY